MSDDWRRNVLPGIVRQLAQRPGHEAVRVALTRLITDGLGREVGAITHERRMPLIGGRVDALFAATVFEIKSDLRRERADVEAQLPGYLAEHGRQRGGQTALGIATDGHDFLAFELRDGAMVELRRTRADPKDPEALLGWLEPAVSDRDDLLPEPLVIARELGRGSLTYARAEGVLRRLWSRLSDHPEVEVKRALWDALLREVYGAPVGDDALFLQHTYLTVLAKTIAMRALRLDVTRAEAEAILSGAALDRIGVRGAVESDFFDWLLQDPEGHDLVGRLARQAARFRLTDVRQDVLKALYESLIDPAQRHDLGEYYTPDWLAAKVCAAATLRPLEQRALDPACGSGTFLFQAIRRLRAAGEEAGWTPAQRVAAATAQVRGLDVHPVAVIIARVTWLLALGTDVAERAGELHVPVFLGDAMQWNVSDVGGAQEVRVPVPKRGARGAPPQDAEAAMTVRGPDEAEPPLIIPAAFAEDQGRLDRGIALLQAGVQRKRPPAQVRVDLARIPGITAADAEAMVATFVRLRALDDAGRDGIWPYVMRNLARPLWLSRPGQQADVLVGNPPWVAFRHLQAGMQRRVREASRRMNLWVGGVLTTQQDLCALFVMRAVQRYLRPGGRLAFVLPYAALNRPAYAGFRRGDAALVQVAWDAAWSLDETVRPLFPVPASVFLGRRAASGKLPTTVRRFTGALPMRDADEGMADGALRVVEAPWPPIPTLAGASPYRARFKQGATIVPRRFWFVERVSNGETGLLGPSPMMPLVRGREGGQDKRPWRDVAPPDGPIEAEFLRSVLLGESLAPFRLLTPALAIVPVTAAGVLMDAAAAEREGFPRLAAWLEQCEAKWALHSAKTESGQTKRSMMERLDHQRTLSQQFPIGELRVAYAASGTLPAATIIQGGSNLVEHGCYWARARSCDEARYLCAVINSRVPRRLFLDMQAKGEGGARHFDNLAWELPIPEYSARSTLHRALARLAERCEQAAAAVPLPATADFKRKRRLIRDALAAAGLSAQLDALVERLLAA